ncbi:hypothetical protein PMAYCL1PPCAC_32732, partial [Pristionchus mayeri]
SQLCSSHSRCMESSTCTGRACRSLVDGILTNPSRRAHPTCRTFQPCSSHSRRAHPTCRTFQPCSSHSRCMESSTCTDRACRSLACKSFPSCGMPRYGHTCNHRSCTSPSSRAHPTCRRSQLCSSH